jgi:exopolysaccharide biosynthesis polyprenyl glycosylphosphotransferase
VVTVPTVLSSTGSVARQRRVARARHLAPLLPLAGLAAAIAVLAVASGLDMLAADVLGAALVWPVVLILVAGRAPAAGPLGRHHGQAVLRSIVAIALAQWLLATWAPIDELHLLLTVAGLGAGTLLATAFARRTQRRADVRPRALVVGDSSHLRIAMSQIAVMAGREVDVVGGCAPEELALSIDSLRPQVVVVIPSARLSGRALQRLAWQVERGPGGRSLPLLVLSGLTDVRVDRSRALSLGGLGVTEVLAARKGGPHGVAKIVWERCAAACALVVLAPVLLGIALLIKLDSPGPALFRQQRVGRDGKLFTMLKLRTMRTDAEAVRDELDNEVEDGVLFKVRQDPRVTRVGRVLRRYSLDEVPQLINVVRGDMSLVGPRPALPSEVAAYDHDPRRRLVVRPGLTGLWQVSGRSDLSWRDSVRLDLDYVDNWSLTRDLAIVGRTLQAVLGHRGAY